MSLNQADWRVELFQCRTLAETDILQTRPALSSVTSYKQPPSRWIECISDQTKTASRHVIKTRLIDASSISEAHVIRLGNVTGKSSSSNDTKCAVHDLSALSDNPLHDRICATGDRRSKMTTSHLSTYVESLTHLRSNSTYSIHNPQQIESEFEFLQLAHRKHSVT